MTKPFEAKTAYGSAWVGTPDRKGLRAVTYNGDLIGMIRNEKSGYRISAMRGKIDDTKFGSVWEPAAKILMAHLIASGKLKEKGDE